MGKKFPEHALNSIEPLINILKRWHALSFPFSNQLSEFILKTYRYICYRFIGTIKKEKKITCGVPFFYSSLSLFFFLSFYFLPFYIKRIKMYKADITIGKKYCPRGKRRKKTRKMRTKKKYRLHTFCERETDF